jgi:transcriptional regulator with XRE-family HTH domain
MEPTRIETAAALIRYLRHSQGVTQAAVADKIGRSPTTISHWLKVAAGEPRRVGMPNDADLETLVAMVIDRHISNFSGLADFVLDGGVRNREQVLLMKALSPLQVRGAQ